MWITFEIYWERSKGSSFQAWKCVEIPKIRADCQGWYYYEGIFLKTWIDEVAKVTIPVFNYITLELWQFSLNTVLNSALEMYTY